MKLTQKNEIELMAWFADEEPEDAVRMCGEITDMGKEELAERLKDYLDNSEVTVTNLRIDDNDGDSVVIVRFTAETECDVEPGEGAESCLTAEEAERALEYVLVEEGYPDPTTECTIFDGNDERDLLVRANYLTQEKLELARL